MRVADAVGAALVRYGVGQVFGVVGSGNFHLTNAMIAAGARFVAARHECGAAMMADGYAQTSGRLAAVSLHQGCGLTNALTGIAEAAKSRTPLLVLAADTAGHAVRSNFRVDQDALAVAVGAVPERVHSPGSALADAARAVRTAVEQRRTVLLNLPLDVQAADLPAGVAEPVLAAAPTLPAPSPQALAELAGLLDAARRPVFIAGRGARSARPALERLADRCGALLATSAVARGLFAGSPWNLDVSGGFATPLAAELIRGADLVIAWGCSLTMWTTRRGTLLDPAAAVVQVDVDPAAIGAQQDVRLGVVGDVGLTAAALLAGTPERAGWRDEAVRKRIEAEGRWRDVPYEEWDEPGRIDPRTLSAALDDLLPAQRSVSIDSGNFAGYPSTYLAVPDEAGFCFTQAFQSIGLGLGTAIGVALARPDRLPVAALGDGGALMGIAELETAARLRLPLVVVVYDDEAYGAEVHHFGPDGDPLETVVFPPTDIAGIGRGFGCDALTVRSTADLAGVADWLAGPRDRPLVIDAKVAAREPSWWLAEAFRGHG